MILFHYFRGVKNGFIATIGFFDGVHLGHQYLIRQVLAEASRRGLAPLLITFDRHPREIFAPKEVPTLLTTTEEKRELLSRCGIGQIHFLHFDHTMATMTAQTFMQRILYDELRVRALVIGYDHHFGKPQFKPATNPAILEVKAEGFEEYAAYGKAIGIDVIRASEIEASFHISSSVIRRALGQGDIHTATQALGRPYQWTGIVTHGQAIGRRLGYPTANLSPLVPSKLLPANGVYAVWACIEGEVQAPAEAEATVQRQESAQWTVPVFVQAMLNIGTRPTVGGNDVSIEAHLIDFEGDLYGHRLTIYFIERIRSEHRFANEQDLAAQLARDKEQAIKLLSCQPKPH